MSEHMKKHPTKHEKNKKDLTLLIEGKSFTYHNIPHIKLSLILDNIHNKLEKYSVSEDEAYSTTHWRELFTELHPKKGNRSGKAIKAYRLREGWTQVEIAKKLKVSQNFISSLENGRKPIGKDLAKRLGKLFHIDPIVFLTWN